MDKLLYAVKYFFLDSNDLLLSTVFGAKWHLLGEAAGAKNGTFKLESKIEFHRNIREEKINALKLSKQRSNIFY